MGIVAKIIIGFVAVEHIYILWFEMFSWEKRGPKVFSGFPKDLYAQTKSMAANQGLYNGFLAAGLIWSLIIADEMWAKNIAFFFLACVVIAGIYGSMTVTKKILYMQAVPAMIGLVVVYLNF